MTKEQALYIFMNSFHVPAYPNTAVPDEADCPYMTYDVQDGDFDSNTSMTVQLWCKTDSEAEPNAKVRQIKSKISEGGTYLLYDGGALWLTCGTPFCINSAMADDNTIKLRQMNININHL